MKVLDKHCYGIIFPIMHHVAISTYIPTK